MNSDITTDIFPGGAPINPITGDAFRLRNRGNTGHPQIRSIAEGTFDEESTYECTDCYQAKPGRLFRGATKPFRTCSPCRFERTPLEIVALDDMLQLDELHEVYPAHADTDGSEIYAFHGYICIEPYMEAMDPADLVERILEEVHRCDQYTYLIKNIGDPELSTNISFGAYCHRSQEIQQQTAEHLLVRMNHRLPAFECYGRVKGTIKKELGYIELNIRHPITHDRVDSDRETRRNAVPMVVRQYITERATERGIDASTLYEAVKTRYPDMTRSLTTMQVYYWWSVGFQSMYRLHDDQMISTRLLLRRYNNIGFVEMFWRRDDHAVAVGFITPFFEKLASCQYVEEYYIDSTFKTNRAGCELFGIVAMTNGVGYPIGYLVYTSFEGAPELTRTNTLAAFLRRLKDFGLNPGFVFSDKDRSQINAVQQVFGESYLRLCIWHIAKSISQKLGENKSTSIPTYNLLAARTEFGFIGDDFTPSIGGRRGVICRKEDRDAIIDLVRKHYNRHPLIPNGNQYETANEIHQSAAREVYEYCRARRLIDAWIYMYKHWYTYNQWRLWARSVVPNRIPYGRANNFIEAHWKVLKCNYLYRHPRARLDMLVYVICDKYFPKVKDKFNSLTVAGNEPTKWAYNFVKHWNKAYRTPENIQADRLYLPSIENWTCGCPAYLQNRYLICKHLVQRSNYRRLAARTYFILRQTSVPFISFRPYTNNVFRDLGFANDNDNDNSDTTNASIIHTTTPAAATITTITTTSTRTSATANRNIAPVTPPPSRQSIIFISDDESTTESDLLSLQTAVLPDREQESRNFEIEMQRSRERRRRLVLQLEEEDRRFDEVADLYRASINEQQRNRFNQQLSGGHIDEYLSDVAQLRRRRTLPTTYRETNANTRHA